MKIRSAVRKICGFCRTLRRGKKVFVKCEKYKRHNQRQGFSTLNVNINETICCCHFNYNNFQTLNQHSFSMPKLNKNLAQSKSTDIKEFDNYKL